jgi:drug/metabolite transporter (DMT)-like permease
VAVFLGLAVAASYGAADFFGGLASKRATSWSVVLLAQYVGLAVLTLLLLADRDASPTGADLLLGAAASSVGVVGVGLLYLGLARGPMGVVAPITAVGSAVVPVAWGLVSGERPAVLALAGVGLALVAVVLVARTTAEAAVPATAHIARSTLVVAVAAGLAFGMVFVLLSHTGDDSVFWPLLSGRLASTTALLAVLAVLRRPLVPGGGTPPIVVLTGVFDVGANALFLLASREGLLSLVSVLSSLYPAVTVVLARAVLHERLLRHQVAGLALALLGVALIASG